MKSMLKKLLIAAVLLSSTSVLAHKLIVSAYVEENSIEGQAYLNNGSTPKNTIVKIINSSDKVVAEIKSNEEGVFKLKNASPDTYIIHVDAGEGHKAKFILNKSEFENDNEDEDNSSDLNNDSKSTDNEMPSEIEINSNIKSEFKKLSSQMRKYRDEVRSYKEHIRVHDVLGGIGYIIGITGMFSFLISRKSRK